MQPDGEPTPPRGTTDRPDPPAPFFRPSPGLTYETMRDGFRWWVPSRFNMGVACADVHPPDATALIARDRAGRRTITTFGALAERSSRLAGGLRRIGVRRGDRVAIVAPQRLETGLAHLATYKLGAVALPLASLFGPDALAFRLADADARVAIVSPENRAKVEEAAAGLDITIVTMDDPMAQGSADAPGTIGFETLAADDPIDPVDTGAEDPALLIYTSGTTGPPKGALHGHRVLIGHLPSFELLYGFYPQPGDRIWTPADWAWIGGLLDVLMPAWYYGTPVVTTTADFSAKGAVELMAAERVTAAFLPPTALKMMRRDLGDGPLPEPLHLRAVFTGGEPLGAEMLRWGREVLGADIDEGYGQTEANLVVGNCAAVWPVRPGSMGRPMPGHTVAVLDEDGHPVVGEVGEVAVRAPDPVMMLGYWRRPDATAEKVRDGWLWTGDLAVEDEDGYLWFRSRKDDVILSMGYRIGPGEIEDSLVGHPAVAMAAVVGAPDPIRGEAVHAYVVLRPGHGPSDELAAELQDHVRHRLAAHEVPRRVSFVDDLPRTTTGKVMRRVLRERLLEGEGPDGPEDAGGTGGTAGAIG